MWSMSGDQGIGLGAWASAVPAVAAPAASIARPLTSSRPDNPPFSYRFSRPEITLSIVRLLALPTISKKCKVQSPKFEGSGRAPVPALNVGNLLCVEPWGDHRGSPLRGQSLDRGKRPNGGGSSLSR